MKTILIIAAVGTLAATGASAKPMHNHHMIRSSHASSGSAATRELNQKSLQQASAGTSMTQRSGAMSDSGAASGTSSGGGMSTGVSSQSAPMTPDATPAGGAVTSPVGPTSSTPPASSTTPQ